MVTIIGGALGGFFFGVIGSFICGLLGLIGSAISVLWDEFVELCLRIGQRVKDYFTNLINRPEVEAEIAL